MNIDTLAVSLTTLGFPNRDCVAYETLANPCDVAPTQLVTLAYCAHTETGGVRCPDRDTCQTVTTYEVRVCDPHEVLMRPWASYVRSEPIEVTA